MLKFILNFSLQTTWGIFRFQFKVFFSRVQLFFSKMSPCNHISIWEKQSRCSREILFVISLFHEQFCTVSTVQFWLSLVIIRLLCSCMSVVLISLYLCSATCITSQIWETVLISSKETQTNLSMTTTGTMSLSPKTQITCTPSRSTPKSPPRPLWGPKTWT